MRGPKHVVTKGATPVLSPTEARKLLESIDTGALAGLRDRALLSVMLYSFARVSAVLGMRRQDYFGQGSRGWLRLHEKGGKRHDVPAHHRAAAALDAYVAARGAEGGALPERGPVGAAADGPGARAAGGAGDGQAARGGRGSAVLDVLPHVPGDGNHGVPIERRDPRARAALSARQHALQVMPRLGSKAPAHPPSPARPPRIREAPPGKLSLHPPRRPCTALQSKSRRSVDAFAFCRTARGPFTGAGPLHTVSHLRPDSTGQFANRTLVALAGV